MIQDTDEDSAADVQSSAQGSELAMTQILSQIDSFFAVGSAVRVGPGQHLANEEEFKLVWF